MSELLARDELQLRFTTFGDHATVVTAKLLLDETNCSFEGPSQTAVRNNELVSFTRNQACAEVRPPFPGVLKLRVVTSSSARLGLWFVSPPGSGSIPDSEQGKQPFLVLARPHVEGKPILFVDGRSIVRGGPEGVKRAELLGRLWRLSTEQVWLLAASLLGCLFLGLTTIELVCWSTVRVRAEPLVSSVGAFLTALALSGGYVLVVPPLQAPDEPSHFLSYANHTRNPWLAQDIEALARESHFGRIVFRSDERFRPISIGAPYSIAWGDYVSATRQAMRSPLTVRWWTLVAPLAGGADSAEVLLRLRFLNAALFALTIGVGAGVLCSSFSSAAAMRVILAILLLPTVPFFAMHVSNYGLLVDAEILLAIGAAGICIGGNKIGRYALLLGLGSSLAISSSVSALPLLVVTFGCMAAYALTETSAWPRSYIVWAAFLAGAALPSPLILEGAGLTKARHYYTLAAFLTDHWTAICCVFAITGAATQAILERFTWNVAVRPSRAFRFATYAVAIWIAVVVVTSAFVRYPTLEPMSARSMWPTVQQYVGEVMRCAITLGRLSGADGLLSKTFWGGFGWLDTYPGDAFVNLLNGGFAIVAAALLVRTARSEDSARCLRLITCIVAGLIALTLYSAAAAVSRIDIHGRYLCGLYLLTTAIVTGLSVHPDLVRTGRIISAVVLPLLATTAHLVCYATIVRRYL